jgi:hypothetical protein
VLSVGGQNVVSGFRPYVGKWMGRLYVESLLRD